MKIKHATYLTLIVLALTLIPWSRGGIVNGDFENPTPTNASPGWRTSGAEILCRPLPFPPVDRWQQYSALLSGGGIPRIRYINQRFVCGDPPNGCVIQFDSIVSPNTMAYVFVSYHDEQGTVVERRWGKIPFSDGAGGTNLGASFMEFPCGDVLTVTFVLWERERVVPPQFLFIDNVVDYCSSSNNVPSRIQRVAPPSGFPFPESPPDPEGTARLIPYADCNGNGNYDILDILMGVSLDENNDGKPDECQLILKVPPQSFTNGFSFLITGMTNGICQSERSVDLVFWTPFYTNQLTSVPTEVRDLTATNGLSGFYRVVLLQDTNPPTITSVEIDTASPWPFPVITIHFSELLDQNTADDRFNYVVSDGTNIFFPNHVTSRISDITSVDVYLGVPLLVGTNYTLTANGMRDLSGNEAPELSVSFSLPPVP